MGEGPIQTMHSRNAARWGDPEVRNWRAASADHLPTPPILPRHRRGKPPREGACLSRSFSHPVPAATSVSHLPAESGSPRMEEAKSHSKRIWAVIVRGWGGEPLESSGSSGVRPRPTPRVWRIPRAPALARGLRASPLLRREKLRPKEPHHARREGFRSQTPTFRTVGTEPSRVCGSRRDAAYAPGRPRETRPL